MITPYEEYIESLQDLRTAVFELKMQSLATKDAVSKVINDSHLRSMLTLQREDIGFRRVLELQRP